MEAWVLRLGRHVQELSRPGSAVVRMGGEDEAGRQPLAQSCSEQTEGRGSARSLGQVTLHLLLSRTHFHHKHCSPVLTHNAL